MRFALRAVISKKKKRKIFIQQTAQINKKFQLSRHFMKSVLIEALLEKARRLCRESTTRDVEFKKVLQLCMCAYQQDPNKFFYML